MTWKIVHKLHNRGLFNISSFRLTAEDGSSKDLVWTTAQDRNVILWQLIENHTPKEVLGIPEMEIPWLCLPTMGGFVYTMATSPLDSSHMALGIGDGSIRLWNMAASKPDMTMLWNGIKGRFCLRILFPFDIYHYLCANSPNCRKSDGPRLASYRGGSTGFWD